MAVKSAGSDNKFLKDKSKKQALIIEAVYSSTRFEGSRTTKKELNEYYVSQKAK